MLLLLSGPVWLSSVELMIAGLDLQALRSGRDHAALLLGKKGGLLLLQLPLLLLQFLLLQELDLCIDVRDGVHGCGRGHHVRGYRGVRRGSRHGMHLIVHGCRQENRSIGPTHRCVECLTVCDLHHAAPIRMLKVAEVKLQALRQTVHAVHVEELLEIIIGAGMHGVPLVVPSCGLHHDHRLGASARAQTMGIQVTTGSSNGSCTERQPEGKYPTDCCADGVRSPPALKGLGLAVVAGGEIPGRAQERRLVCAAQLQWKRRGQEGRGHGQDNVDTVTQHAERRHEQRLEARGRR